MSMARLAARRPATADFRLPFESAAQSGHSEVPGLEVAAAAAAISPPSLRHHRDLLISPLGVKPNAQERDAQLLANAAHLHQQSDTAGTEKWRS